MLKSAHETCAPQPSSKQVAVASHPGRLRCSQAWPYIRITLGSFLSVEAWLQLSTKPIEPHRLSV